MKKIASERNRTCLGNGKLTIGYLLAGFPDKEDFLDLLPDCEAAGMDVFEIGYPSENPVADGKVIRKAHGLVDHSIKTDLGYWGKIRRAVDSPIWVMAYKKDLIDTDFYKLLARNELADAFVLPDASFRQRLALKTELEPFGVDVLGFVDPDMEQEEQEACFNEFSLIYQQLYSGPTGMSVATQDYREILDRAKTHENLKVFAGFGIQTAERAAQLVESGFDGVIIGTAMMSKLNASREELLSFVRELASTVRKGR